MDSNLDLHDIQGNIIKGYGRYGFPKARYVFFRIKNEALGRAFINSLLPKITSSIPWSEKTLAKPKATTNVAFTYQGLQRLGLPRQSLQSFPDAFAMGMKARRDILGDDGHSAPQHWDPIWQDQDGVDIWLSINGQSMAALEHHYHEVVTLVANTNGGIEQLGGHRGRDGATDLLYQEASALYQNGIPGPKEHFGYTDGISDPFFKGTGTDPANVLGGGKPTGKDPATLAGWEPLETGEFILGHRDEAFEYPKAPMPPLLPHNGTFMVYRKLHENVGSFNEYIDNVGKDFPGGKEHLAAKFAGRWRNGAPITSFPSEQEADEYTENLANAEASRGQSPQAEANYQELRKKLLGFDYTSPSNVHSKTDLAGQRCPMGAHVRRTNPRGALEYGVKNAYNTPGALINRRRILRRGLPYGEALDAASNDGDHGIIFMALNADIKRQFEFVQQQWVNYGNDFKLANDKDPLLGNHHPNSAGEANGRMLIESDPEGNEAPFFCSAIPRLVELRGGDYFFIPSLTALRMIAEGIMDPT